MSSINSKTSTNIWKHLVIKTLHKILYRNTGMSSWWLFIANKNCKSKLIQVAIIVSSSPTLYHSFCCPLSKYLRTQIISCKLSGMFLQYNNPHYKSCNMVNYVTCPLAYLCQVFVPPPSPRPPSCKRNLRTRFCPTSIRIRY